MAQLLRRHWNSKNPIGRPSFPAGSCIGGYRTPPRLSTSAYTRRRPIPFTKLVIQGPDAQSRYPPFTEERIILSSGQPCSDSARQRRGDIDVLLGKRRRPDQRAFGPVQVSNPAHVVGQTFVRRRSATSASG